jgi:D-alanine-D-alanine ligase
MAIVNGADALAGAMPGAMGYDGCVMLEQFIKGTEVTCGVLDADSAGPRALPVTEIRPLTASFFDYNAKYTPGASTEITPAEISDDAAAEVQSSAVRAHKVIGCGIWSRSDFLIGSDGPVWLEVNTIPGLTPTSLFPQAAAAAGITFPELCNMFVEAAMKRSRL